MDENKRKLLPRRKQDMKDNVYKILLGVMIAVGVGALVDISDKVGNIEEIVHADQVTTGKHGIMINANERNITENKNDIKSLRNGFGDHTLNDAKYRRFK